MKELFVGGIKNEENYNCSAADLRNGFAVFRGKLLND